MDFIDDFIQEYKNNPCLWKADSANYKNRSKRQEAYMKLIDVAAKHGEHYNVERTKQKINNLRCAFRHQLKKYNELKTKGEKEEPYCPKRKYFESLMFLKDEETRDKRILNNSSKIDSANSEITITSIRGSNGKNERRLLSTETESASLEVDTDKQSSLNGVEDALQVPNNLFSDICKEIHKENNGTEVEDDMTGEESTATVNISVISDKGTPLGQEFEEIAITPIRKDQVFIVDTSNTNNSTTISNATTTTTATSNIVVQPHIKQQQLQLHQQQTNANNKSRKRSSSFSSQHSNETDTTTPIKTSKSDITLDIENILSLACKNFQKNTSDHYTSFGEIVAHKLRTMDAKQAIYAEKIISDILYQGQMKYLSTASIERCSQIHELTHQQSDQKKVE
ncbi:uncharacterized protein ACRADG_010916 [Cochliomyia hominivorax]